MTWTSPDGRHRLLQGDVREVLATLPAQSVHVCATSPPYWGLRSYVDEEHEDKAQELGSEAVPDCLGWATGSPCGTCYVCHMVEVFRGVRRVLRDEGTVWLNLGDTYATGSGGTQTASVKQKSNRGTGIPPRKGYRDGVFKPKDLCGIPWRVALALQADGWYLRSDIVWSKPSPMPESVQDRPTKAHEYVFLLTKQPRYFYDAIAIQEASSRLNGGRFGSGGIEVGRLRQDASRPRLEDTGTRNKRSVWTIAKPMYRLRHDLSPEQRAYVLQRIAAEGLR